MHTQCRRFLHPKKKNFILWSFIDSSYFDESIPNVHKQLANTSRIVYFKGNEKYNFCTFNPQINENQQFYSGISIANGLGITIAGAIRIMLIVSTVYIIFRFRTESLTLLSVGWHTIMYLSNANTVIMNPFEYSFTTSWQNLGRHSNHI